MSDRPRWRLLALLAGLGPACGSGSSGSGTADGGACTVDLQCDDGNPCSIDSCGDGGLCTATPGPDGEAQEQAPGDCRRTVCTLGVPSYEVDTGDAPDDGEDCTLDSCNEAGAPSHQPKIDDSPCAIGQGSGTCKGGRCLVLCSPGNASAQCDDANPCTSDACLPCPADECDGLGLCGHSALSNSATPGAPQSDGDCIERRCVEGKDEDVADLTDVPNDGNDCTDDRCTAVGIPVNEPMTERTECSGGLCRSDATCVECITVADCSLAGSSCRVPACTDGTCSTVLRPEGTVLPPSEQADGDCERRVCDASGNSTGEVDVGDVPDDGKVCTTDSCSSTGSQVHTPLPVGTPCSGGGTCNASGNCCTPTTCASQGRTCGSSSDGCGTTLDCGSCSGGDLCTSAGVCRCENGVRDGSEAGVDCGGGCPNACPNGTACFAPTTCTSGECVDGVCCDTSCTGSCRSCRAVETGNVDGVCSTVSDFTDPGNDCPAEAATSCGRSGECRFGTCAFHPSGALCGAAACVGGTLFAPDTCDGAGTCASGVGASCDFLTGAPPGTYVCSGPACESCTDGILNGSEMGTDCGGGSPCGTCGIGTPCSTGIYCQTGECVDGVCCDNPCSGLCRRCDLPGSTGTCTNIAAGLDPNGECPGNRDCNGAGACT